MGDQDIMPISTRSMKLNQIVVGKSNSNFSKQNLIHSDSLLDALFALYDECSADYLKKDRHISAFVEKFKGVMTELKSLRVNLKDFEVKAIIGHGHFGEVKLVQEKATGDVYAMKILRKHETLAQQNMAFFEEERDIMAKSKSPWLTRLHYAFQDPQNLYLVMEFHSGGDLLALLERHDNVLCEEMCKFYLAELVLAIHSLHAMGYVHRDIKPDNILIDRTGHIKLADFGSSSKLNCKKQVTSGMPAGTPDYVAPEVLTVMDSGQLCSKSYGTECDWWSLGIVAYEMLFGYTPFGDEKVLITYNNIMNYKNTFKFPPEASEVSDNMKDIVQNLIRDPNSRLGYEQLISHLAFTDIDWNSIREIPPPYVPVVTSVDDTSNFDGYEPNNRPYLGHLHTQREFSGRNLPFIGFTYISTFEDLVKRHSTSDELSFSSPSVSLTEVDASLTTRKRELSFLQNRLLESEKKLERLAMDLQEKEIMLERTQAEKAVFEKLSKETKGEAEQFKLLLSYEREHRLITEKKATHLVLAMKMKHKQDAYRLKLKSLKLHNGENMLGHDLENALQRIEEMGLEKDDLIAELHDAQHALVESQKQYSFLSSSTSSESSGFNEGRNAAVFYSQLLAKLERKNIQLEQELESSLVAKKRAEVEIRRILKARVDKENNESSIVIQHQEKVASPVTNYEKELKLKNEKIQELEQIINSLTSTNDALEHQLEKMKADLARVKPSEHVQESEEDSSHYSSLPDMSEKDRPEQEEHKSEDISDESPAMSSAETDYANAQDHESSDICWELKTKQTNGMQERLLASNLKQENEALKTEIDALNTELIKLKENTKSAEKLRKQLKETEAALSDVKLDLRVMTRKEQQADSMSSTLRERNKDLREQLRTIEAKTTQHTKVEEQLKEKIESLEQQVTSFREEANEKEKNFQVDKARLEARIQTLRDMCENSKNVNQEFQKTQGQYEELSRSNADLRNENQEKHSAISELKLELKTVKSDHEKSRKECERLSKVNNALKSAIVELEQDLEDLKIIVESRNGHIAQLSAELEEQEYELEKMKNKLKNANCGVKDKEAQEEKYLNHIKELTTELENQNELHEAEEQDLQEKLSHYEGVISDLENRTAELQRELSLQNCDSRSHSEKMDTLQEQLCVIKEEAARHITQISSLKTSNMNLTQNLEDALQSLQEAHKNMDELSDQFKNEKVSHLHEKVKLKETVAQQSKLIDFLQSKTENVEKKKRTNIARLFGGKRENHASCVNDVEKQLETERGRIRRLQDELSRSRAEKVALWTEINSLKQANAEVPVSPKSLAMHTAIAFSPSNENSLGQLPGVKHKIPHRFSQGTCMRSNKCAACLGSIPFGKPLDKCQECYIVCHPGCSHSVPNTCSLPSAFMDHFKSLKEQSPAEDPIDAKCEGWVKVPKSNKQNWEQRYLRLVDEVLFVYESENSNKALTEFDFASDEAKLVVTSAVPASELPHTAASDLLFILKIESFPYTTCWPQRNLYIMTLGFKDKQKWVSQLENLAEKNLSEVEDTKKNKLIGRILWTVTNDDLIDPMCTSILDQNTILLGAEEGLFVLRVSEKFSYSLKEKIDGFSNVYQIKCLKRIGVLMLIQGLQRKLCYADLRNFQSSLLESSHRQIPLQSVSETNLSDCHLFVAEDTDAPWLCVATSDKVILCQWEAKEFIAKKIIEANEPCSCIMFTRNSVIFGTDVFYSLNLEVFSIQRFLDQNDPSLAGLVFCASHLRSFPVAIFQVSPNGHTDEFLLCFHELGVFVNGKGQRTRPDDLKFNRLPLSIAYHSPYLFLTHFRSLEVIEIPPLTSSEPGQRVSTSLYNPQLMGEAHVQKSVLISTTRNNTMELLLFDGSLLYNTSYETDETTSVSYSGSVSSGLEEGDGVDLDFSFVTSLDGEISSLGSTQ